MNLGVVPTLALVVPKINYWAILPDLILIGGALAVLALSSLTGRRFPAIWYSVSTAFLALATLGSALYLWFDITGKHHHAFVAIDAGIAVDGFSQLITMLVAATLFLVALSAPGYLRREGAGGPEFYVLSMLSASGAVLMGSANDLIVMFLGLEVLSIALYVMAGSNLKAIASGEAALKYFILGAFSSAIFLYGIALTYGSTGSTNLASIANYLAKNLLEHNGVLLAGAALMLLGFGFKVALVPFHAWSPDVYQGSPTPSVAFMSSVAKAAGFAGLIRVFYSALPTLRLDWQPVLWVLSVATLLVGSVLAVVQTDVKRMLAYSSISHAGFILIGLVAANPSGIAGSLYYLFTYSFLAVGSFTVVALVAGKGDSNHSLASYRGLSKRHPYLAAAMALMLIAQAGIPFTTGFLGKFYVLAAATDAHSYALALIAILSSVIAAFFYLRLGVLMYAPDGGELAVAPAVASGSASGSAQAGSASSAAATALAGTELLDAEDELLPVTRKGSWFAVPDDRGGDPILDDPAMAGSGVALVVSGDEAISGEVVNGPGAVGELRAPEIIDVPSSEKAGRDIGAAISIAICCTVTVFFGVFPSMLIDFAKQAKLLF